MGLGHAVADLSQRRVRKPEGCNRRSRVVFERSKIPNAIGDGLRPPSDAGGNLRRRDDRICAGKERPARSNAFAMQSGRRQRHGGPQSDHEHAAAMKNVHARTDVAMS